MDKEFAARTFDFSCVVGLSPCQLSEHYKLYKGYVDNLNEIRLKLPSANRENVNPTYSPYRGLKKSETYALDGIKLHELYFDNLCALDQPSEQFINIINKSFGCYDKWIKDLKACGKSARGWAVTAFDPADGRIHNFLQDAHDDGPIWLAYPLVVLDVYEHAYFIDFGTNRDKYLDTFIKNINWNIVNLRLAVFLKAYPQFA